MDLDLSSLENAVASRKMGNAYEEAAVQKLDPLDESLEEYFDSITLPGGHEVQVKVIRPKEHVRAGKKPPLIFLMHGGAFVAGSTHQLTRPGRDFALRFGAVVILSTYRLGPEHQFPTQFQDCWDTLVELTKNATQKFGAYLEQGFVVGGASSGGTLAAPLVQHAHEKGLTPPITGTYLAVPMLLVEEIVPERFKRQWTSREENVPFPSVNRSTLKAWQEIMGLDVKSPMFSPFNVPPEKLQGLPRTYFQVGGLDPLRDDGLIYERLLKENGVETKIDNYPDLEHMTWSIFTNESHPKDLGPNTLAGMAWLLRRE